MSCDSLRNRLMDADGAPFPRNDTDHLEGCADCRRFVERLTAARHALKSHHGNVEPDAAFAARVAARLPQGPAELLGWAAARLIPATLVLVLVLGWFAYRGAPVETVAEQSAPTDDLVSWVLDPSGEGQ